jgi:hypothetical protein
MFKILYHIVHHGWPQCEKTACEICLFTASEQFKQFKELTQVISRGHFQLFFHVFFYDFLLP